MIPELSAPAVEGAVAIREADVFAPNSSTFSLTCEAAIGVATQVRRYSDSVDAMLSDYGDDEDDFIGSIEGPPLA